MNLKAKSHALPIALDLAPPTFPQILIGRSNFVKLLYEAAVAYLASLLPSRRIRSLRKIEPREKKIRRTFHSRC